MWPTCGPWVTRMGRQKVPLMGFIACVLRIAPLCARCACIGTAYAHAILPTPVQAACPLIYPDYKGLLAYPYAPDSAPVVVVRVVFMLSHIA